MSLIDYTPFISVNLSYFHLFFKPWYNGFMSWKKILAELNIVARCKKYGVSLWQCPQFLFLLMGVVIIITTTITYKLGTQVADPDTVLLIVFALTIVLFVVTFSITRSMEGLAEANQLKSEFISIVSHQLRSPLSNLKWSVELLMSGRVGNITEKQAEYMKILKDNTGRMGELISDLLTVSRIEQGRFPLEKAEFSLKELAEQIIGRYKAVAEDSQVELSLEAAEDLPQAFGDLSRIKMVAENFVDNAIRYIKGGGEVRIKIEPKNKHLLFSVQDNGVGIPQSDQKNIFQKFFRSKNALKHQIHGSGLGLYIAKSIVEISGGKIGFKSKENKGSTFWFTLPIKTI